VAWASRARLFGCGPHPAWVALRPLPASCLPGHTTPHRGPLWPSRLSECRQSERERVASWLSAQSCTSAGERAGVLGPGNPTEVWQTSDHVGYYSDLRRCAAQQQILQLWSLSRPVPKPRPVPSGVCEEGECSLWLVSRLSLQSLPSRREDCHSAQGMPCAGGIATFNPYERSALFAPNEEPCMPGPSTCSPVLLGCAVGGLGVSNPQVCPSGAHPHVPCLECASKQQTAAADSRGRGSRDDTPAKDNNGLQWC
jgi:hypothetical protein